MAYSSYSTLQRDPLHATTRSTLQPYALLPSALKLFFLILLQSNHWHSHNLFTQTSTFTPTSLNMIHFEIMHFKIDTSMYIVFKILATLYSLDPWTVIDTYFPLHFNLVTPLPAWLHTSLIPAFKSWQLALLYYTIHWLHALRVNLCKPTLFSLKRQSGFEIALSTLLQPNTFMPTTLLYFYFSVSSDQIDTPLTVIFSLTCFSLQT